MIPGDIRVLRLAFSDCTTKAEGSRGNCQETTTGIRGRNEGGLDEGADYTGSEMDRLWMHFESRAQWVS